MPGLCELFEVSSFLCCPHEFICCCNTAFKALWRIECVCRSQGHGMDLARKAGSISGMEVRAEALLWPPTPHHQPASNLSCLTHPSSHTGQLLTVPSTPISGIRTCSSLQVERSHPLCLHVCCSVFFPFLLLYHPCGKMSLAVPTVPHSPFLDLALFFS